MYIPTHFNMESKAEAISFIEQNSFGALVVNKVAGLSATHIPFVYSESKDGLGFLYSHISVANPQLNEISVQTEVMVIFQGANTYVSSSWYDHVNVPTWNYIAVHVYGKIRIIEGEELIASLGLLVGKHESNSPNAVTMESMPKDFLNSHIKGIIGFEIQIERMEGVKKLSQNRDDKNYKNIISELEKASDGNSGEIAAQMRKMRKVD